MSPRLTDAFSASRLRVCCLLIIALRFALASCAVAAGATNKNSKMNSERISVADLPPRKVLIGNVMHNFRGDLSARVDDACRMIDAAAQEAAQKYPGKGLDLVVLPEHAIQATENAPAAARAVPLEGVVLEKMGAKARRYHSYIIVPMLLLETKKHEGKDQPVYSNAAVLLDRDGNVVGTYRKVHPVADPNGLPLEGGVTPGDSFPVFACDFGKVGIQICWDMSYEDGWLELARKGAEIVAVSSASPQTVRPASYALRGTYYVVTSTPRDNVTIFNPVGMVAAQSTSGDVLVHQVDLSYARLHWSANLRNGQLFTETYGDKVGYQYSEREDTGVFWSNDPAKTIGSMVRELGLLQQTEQIERDRKLQDSVRGTAIQK